MSARSLAMLLCPLVSGLFAQEPAAALVAPDDELLALEGAVRRSVLRVAPSVVTIETFGGTRKALSQKKDGKPDEPVPDMPGRRPEEAPKDDKDDKKKLGPIRMEGFLQAQGATTGIVLEADGWILTSRFNLEYDPTTILVTLADGRKFTAKVMGQDRGRALAVLKIEATGLPVPEFVPPSAARVGQWALNLGRAFGGKDPSVHMGVVSALDRLGGRAIQMDAYASPANYGGPLVDLQGRVLGLITPVSPDGRDASVDWYDSGIGFAATWLDVPEYMAKLKKNEVSSTGYLGVNLNLGYLGPGALIDQVMPDSPAQKAGLAAGSVVMEVEGVPVRQNFHLQDLVSRRTPGDFVALKVRHPPGPRPEPTMPDLGAMKNNIKKKKFDPADELPTVVAEGGEVVDVTVILGERPKGETAPKVPNVLPMPGQGPESPKPGDLPLPEGLPPGRK